MIGQRSSHRFAIAWLVLCSLFFYGWWNPAYLGLIIFSIIFNYSLGRFFGNNNTTIKKYFLWIGVLINLGLLGYFKYSNFFFEQITFIKDFNFEYVLLPLAISFFTFQQIAFLVDSYRNETKEYDFLHYCLFVTFFPQLVAGPIVHHKEILPQFRIDDNFKLKSKNIAIGLSIFSIGLFKKTVIADGLAPYSNVVFDSALSGDPITLFTAWGGALAYTFQLYFDFSGYSDMAIGLARMFGIMLPINFYSPYKALNISEFWRRWHITLSNFLRDYVYIALGGNRKGSISRYRNLFLTMLLGGIWHGAGWNFAVWGALHGSYLMINHAWIKYANFWPNNFIEPVKKLLSWGLTFIAVVVGWVFFRATSFDAAISILQGMCGMNGISVPNGIIVRLGFLQEIFKNLGVTASLGGGSSFTYTWLWIIAVFPFVLLSPNTQDLFFKAGASLSTRNYDKKSTFWPFYKNLSFIYWKSSRFWAVAISLLLVFGLLTLSQVSEFLYFKF